MRLLSRLDEWAMCLVLWALFLVVALQFFTRYVLNDSLGWTEEVARMMLIVLTYVGAVVCARKRSHIRVDLILDMLPVRLFKPVIRLIDLGTAAFFVFLSWTAMQFALITKLRMSSIELPKSVIFWICAASLLFIALHYFVHALKGDADRSNPGSGA
ncbi:MAG: TRAP transporter small permease [Albidovulum sp.]|uniref:TRAP transporter small permease n=1 Tax=Albidovulum sp. TaxID=1872424 RepID=UPI003C83E97B